MVQLGLPVDTSVLTTAALRNTRHQYARLDAAKLLPERLRPSPQATRSDSLNGTNWPFVHRCLTEWTRSIIPPRLWSRFNTARDSSGPTFSEGVCLENDGEFPLCSSLSATAAFSRVQSCCAKDHLWLNGTCVAPRRNSSRRQTRCAPYAGVHCLRLC